MMLERKFEVLDFDAPEGEGGIIVFDTHDINDAMNVRAFLKAYLVLCRKYGCCVVAEECGSGVEVIPDQEVANRDDPWRVKWLTEKRGWVNEKLEGE